MKSVLSILTAFFLLIVASATLDFARAEDNKGVKSELQSIEEKLKKEKEKREILKKKTSSLKKQEETLGAELIIAAKSAQKYERDMSQVEETLLALEEAEKEKLKTLRQGQEQFVGVLGALERLARNPPEALIAQPLSSSDLVRSAILLRAAVPQIEQQATTLKKDLASLAETRESVVKRRKELASLTTKLKSESKRLTGLISKKKATRKKMSVEQKKASARLKRLTEQAKDLRDLFKKLEQNRRKEAAKAVAAAARAEAEAEKAKKNGRPPPKNSGSLEVANLPGPAGGSPISKARGSLWRPAVGRVIGVYGGRLDTGLTRKGMNIRTRPNAHVVAPYDGRVVYAGPFRGYGQLLIIEHGEGYHTLLSGMGQIDGVVGQWLLAGEPVGTMGKNNSGKPTLYLEMRKDGQPINPVPWLVAGK